MRIKEVKVHGVSHVYRLVEADSDGRERPTCRFRVRKRIKSDNKWTTRVSTFDNFEDAKAFSRKKPETIHSTTLGSEKFSAVFERFLVHKRVKERLASGSLDGYRNRARHLRFFEEMPMNKLTPKAVDAWLDLLFTPEYLERQQKGRVNYEHEYFLLSGIFTYYRNHENEDYKVPLLERHREIACRRRRSDEVSEIRYLHLDEECQFLSELSGTSVIHDLAMFQLHTGVRIGEAAALEFRNVDFRQNEVLIGQHLHWERKKGSRIEVLPGTKGGPTRRVLLTTECKEMLVRRRISVRSRVFPSSTGAWLSYRTIQNAYDRAFARMGVPHRGTHTLRHTFAVRFLEQTKDVHALQRLLGHSDLKDTLRYAKYTNESVKRSFQLFRGGLAGGYEGGRSITGSTELTQLQN